MCLGTISVRQKDGFVHVPCGKCVQCLQRKRSQWTFRLLQELKIAQSATFLTLTYNDDNIPIGESGLQTLQKKHCQLFLKRLRKLQSTKSKHQLRYFLVGEYGTETNRPHYHMILFNLHKTLFLKAEKIWGLGNIRHDDVNQATIHYVTKYLINVHQTAIGVENPFQLSSKRPYLGYSYAQELKDGKLMDKKHMIDYHRKNLIANVSISDGIPLPLPKVYKKKIFTDNDIDKVNKKLIAFSDDYEKKIDAAAIKRRVNKWKQLRLIEVSKLNQLKKQAKSM